MSAPAGGHGDWARASGASAHRRHGELGGALRADGMRARDGRGDVGRVHREHLAAGDADHEVSAKDGQAVDSSLEAYRADGTRRGGAGRGERLAVGDAESSAVAGEER